MIGLYLSTIRPLKQYAWPACTLRKVAESQQSTNTPAYDNNRAYIKSNELHYPSGASVIAVP